MCGIFGVINDQSGKAAQTVLAGLKKLEYRGYDSWGIAIKPAGSNKLIVDKHIGKIGGATTDLPSGSISIGHTRWATHGGVTDYNAHPHLDCTGKIAVIHNGIIENYQTIKDELLKKNHEFLSETDTEIVAHLIEEKRKHSTLLQAVLDSFKDLSGSNAIAVLDLETESIIACRNGSPLVAGLDKKQFFIGSDVPAFLKYTNKVHFLNDGEAALLSIKGIEIFEISSGKKINYKPQVLDWKLEDAEKGGHSHFLLKEILEQINTIPKAVSLNKKEIIKIAAMIKDGYKVIFSACGTASYCGLAAKYFFAEVGVETQMHGAYEFLPFSVFCNSKTVFIAISQSGETADTIIAAKEAKKKGAHLVAVVNARGSTLERISDTVLFVGAGPEIAVVSTKAFTSQLATLYLLSKAVEKKYEQGKSEIKSLGKVLDKWLSKKLLKQILKTAKYLMEHEDMYIIGKHLNYPATLEFALKIKEASYIHAEPFAAGELKHGVITLIQKDTVCFALFNNDKVMRELFSSAAELKARGGYIIGVGPSDSKEFNVVIKTPDLGNLTIFPNIIIGQLLGYYLGVGRGTDPDKPRNLAKSVTVK
ncbi:MAG: Glucosamine/fructose-6-phosphate aminotransferase, isomerizing [Candidatus Roizmanbacteria bacterium GW2011_GWA2_36_23]|uniref:Glutamine--fructose-6-phosphate aminotransferase [isomerizing] n=1 Tax=Candidatus Roizmanbacteria bacterium GW2011_GWA2_36_23 TaxID=1618480 RepID=A0A0G0EL65_9BACT|nr:MAG: Glucosamine/fructose-6-phosphate aminotransferase, isomerizing [Candidatus Roizmanbacteria bacterium GW2011_GWA2_36_23]